MFSLTAPPRMNLHRRFCSRPFVSRERRGDTQSPSRFIMLRITLLYLVLSLAHCSPDRLPTAPAGKALSTESTADRNALRAYYTCILEDLGGGKLSVLANSHWMSRSTLAKWHGIAINGSGRVVEVDIPYPYQGSDAWSERVRDAIDQDAFGELTSLDQLQVLNLRHNFLQILIEPGDFNNFRQLRSLDLSGNLVLPKSDFSEFRKLTNLEHLSLPVPADKSIEPLCGLSSLQSLDLTFQGEVSIPSCIGNLSNLETLRIEGSYFDLDGVWDMDTYTSIYDHKESCPNPVFTSTWGLFTLNCESYKNKAAGRDWIDPMIPAPDSLAFSHLQDLTSLRSLTLDNLGLTSIPDWIGELTQLEELHIPAGYYMSGNPMTGPLPPGLGQLTKLKVLWTVASGPLPPEIGNMESLEAIKLIGPYSDSGAREIEEEGLLLSGNEKRIQDLYATKLTLEEIEALPGLDGPLPPVWGNLTNLKHLTLIGYLSGSLPPEWSGMTSLESIYLPDSELTGPIPAAWGQMTLLRTLNLNNNLLSGSLPTQIGGMVSLERLFLRGNQLTGKIPAEVASLTALRLLGLSHNQLTGSLIDFSEMSSLEILSLNDNQLSGKINGRHFPVSIKEIRLAGNDFSGSFPNLTHLTELRSFSHETSWFAPIGASEVCPKLPKALKESLSNHWACGP